MNIDANNPLLNFTKHPRYSEMRLEHLQPALEHVIKKLNKVISEITMGKNNWNDTMGKLADAEERVDLVMMQGIHMLFIWGIWNGTEHQRFDKCCDDSNKKSHNNVMLYRKLKTLSESCCMESETASRKKMLERKLRKFVSHGVHLGAQQRRELNRGNINKYKTNVMQYKNFMDGKAKILGYRSHADRALDGCMFDTVTDAKNMISKSDREMVEKLKKVAAQTEEYKEAQINGEPFDMGKFQLKLLAESKKFVGDDFEYCFPYNKVIQGVITLLYKVYGISIKETSIYGASKTEKYYEVLDNNKEIAGLYINSRAIPFTENVLGYSHRVISRVSKCDGEQLPISHIMCCFKTPENGVEAMLTLDDVQTLLHEFGHALEHILTKETEFYASDHKINGREVDLAEVVSIMMEHFIYDYETIKPMTMHKLTGKEIKVTEHEKMVYYADLIMTNAILGECDRWLEWLELTGEIQPRESYEYLEKSYSKVKSGALFENCQKYLIGRYYGAKIFSRLIERKPKDYISFGTMIIDELLSFSSIRTTRKSLDMIIEVEHNSVTDK